MIIALPSATEGQEDHLNNSPPIMMPLLKTVRPKTYRFYNVTFTVKIDLVVKMLVSTSGERQAAAGT